MDINNKLTMADGDKGNIDENNGFNETIKFMSQDKYPAIFNSERRNREIYLLARGLKFEGYEESYALKESQKLNKDHNRPFLSDEELTTIVGQVFQARLKICGIDRNKNILELAKKYKVQGRNESDILEAARRFNTNCNIPPLDEKDLQWIVTTMSYAYQDTGYCSGSGYNPPGSKTHQEKGHIAASKEKPIIWVNACEEFGSSAKPTNNPPPNIGGFDGKGH